MSNFQNFSDLSPKMQFFVSKVFPLIFVVVGLALFLIYLPGLLDAHASKSWPSAKGIVTQSEIGSTPSSASRRGTYFPVVHYEFSINGTTYTGDNVTFDLDKSGNAIRARDTIKRYTKGQDVTVYYRPNEPETCLLEPGISVHTCYVPGLGILFIFVGGILALSIKQNNRFTDQNNELDKP